MRDLVAKPQRCAIYTRKSTEHNLDLAFNSLDAQREACEAYIKSQAHEGWRLVPEPFDDGGLSGASLERPALQRLLDAVRAGLVDIIVVYKVDRLTRSLADFAKLVELFDANSVSFVSVTQSFNTTTSMGRLTLNVLLSFAQFEREVIGERVRDKIAASKTKGLWVGGPIPLGYRSEKKQLLVVDAEAAQVRRLFQLYLELGSIGALTKRLHAEGIVTRRGYRYRGGALAHLLKNRFYLGQIAWRGALYTGAHTPIVDVATFDAVQAQLASGAIVRHAHYASSASTLSGLLYDDAGHRMTPSHTRKRGVRYRYYVSQAVLQHHKGDAGTVSRVCAPEIEAAVATALRNPSGSSDRPLADRVSRVTLTAEHLLIDLIQPEDASERIAPIKVPFERMLQGRRKGIAHEPQQRLQLDQASSEALLSGIGRARIWMSELVRGTQTTHSIALRDELVERHVRRLLPLACLSPTIIRAIADGTARADLTITALTAALPHDWPSQNRRFLAL